MYILFSTNNPAFAPDGDAASYQINYIDIIMGTQWLARPIGKKEIGRTMIHSISGLCLSLDMCTALAKPCGDGKCRVDAHEIHTCLYNMIIT